MPIVRPAASATSDQNVRLRNGRRGGAEAWTEGSVAIGVHRTRVAEKNTDGFKDTDPG
jgi:hypothetical protein